MAKTEIIDIKWKGPLTPKQAYKKNDALDKGVYQVYGDHPVYGLNVLLYIGKTQEFGERLGKHGFEGWNQDIQIYLGIISIPITKEKLKQVEGLLIHACWPAYNSQHIQSAPKGCDDLLILNWEKFRSLPEAIYGYRTSKGSLAGVSR